MIEHTFGFYSVPSVQHIHNHYNSSVTSIFQTCVGHLSPYLDIEKAQLFTALITQRMDEFHATMLECLKYLLFSYHEDLRLSQPVTITGKPRRIG